MKCPPPLTLISLPAWMAAAAEVSLIVSAAVTMKSTCSCDRTPFESGPHRVFSHAKQRQQRELLVSSDVQSVFFSVAKPKGITDATFGRSVTIPLNADRFWRCHDRTLIGQRTKPVMNSHFQ